VGLILAAFFGFAVDVQTGVPRVWTVIGLVLFIVASFGLYDGLTLPWITLLAGVVGVVLTVYAGMPTMVRTRFSTPTIGRDWMIGELGTAVVDVAPTGVVRVRDALWRAETNRATPLAAEQTVRVVGIQGLLLEVEPEEGAARDYRER
jgi:membrane-bound serine protease (ClpP class)